MSKHRAHGVESRVSGPRTSVLVLALVAFSCSSSCLIPEKFSLSIDIAKDGTYAASYSGTVVHPVIRSAAVEGDLSPADEREAKQLEEEFLKQPGYRKAKYLGEGRYDVHFAKKGKRSQSVQVFEDEDTLITLTPLPDGKVVVEGFAIPPDMLGELASLKVEMDGTVELRTDGVVLEHNAKSKPWLFGLLGAYTWQIKSVKDPAPRAVIQL